MTYDIIQGLLTTALLVFPAVFCMAAAIKYLMRD